MSIIKIPCKLFKTLLLEYNVAFLWYKMFLLLICSELRTLGNSNSVNTDEQTLHAL